METRGASRLELNRAAERHQMPKILSGNPENPPPSQAKTDARTMNPIWVSRANKLKEGIVFMPRGSDTKREREYNELKSEFKKEHRYRGREEEVAARIVNKQRAKAG